MNLKQRAFLFQQKQQFSKLGYFFSNSEIRLWFQNGNTHPKELKSTRTQRCGMAATASPSKGQRRTREWHWNCSWWRLTPECEEKQRGGKWRPRPLGEKFSSGCESVSPRRNQRVGSLNMLIFKSGPRADLISKRHPCMSVSGSHMDLFWNTSPLTCKR